MNLTFSKSALDFITRSPLSCFPSRISLRAHETVFLPGANLWWLKIHNKQLFPEVTRLDPTQWILSRSPNETRICWPVLASIISTLRRAFCEHLGRSSWIVSSHLILRWSNVTGSGLRWLATRLNPANEFPQDPQRKPEFAWLVLTFIIYSVLNSDVSWFSKSSWKCLLPALFCVFWQWPVLSATWHNPAQGISWMHKTKPAFRDQFLISPAGFQFGDVDQRRSRFPQELTKQFSLWPVSDLASAQINMVQPGHGDSPHNKSPQDR